ncbi:MAG: hypothetical protein B6241_01940 [Spirochaetaceae bacterium 4572_59]|nr:MAG: hypothetical protein B6241_01940 [Spirochaetaceae bacterium 4572_59]
MVKKAIQTLLLPLFFLFFSGVLELTGEENAWAGPVQIKEFSFDVLNFYSIGWSRQGRVAYGITFPGEGGWQSWQWFIQDLIEDKILYSSPEWTLMTDQSPAELWDRHPEWHSQLLRFGIAADATILRGEKTFRIDEVSYSLEVFMDRSETPEAPQGLCREISIQFYRNHNSAKAIYDYKPDPAQEVVDDMILKGYIKNPSEKRIAVIALEKSGPASSLTQWKYRVFGAHLSFGFSPVIRKGSDLVEAVLNGQFYVSRMYLQDGADTEEKDSRGYTALLLASRRGLWDISHLLLEAGADPNPSDDRGRTPLHYAVAGGSIQTVKLLLQRGADPEQKDAAGLSPRQEAVIKGNPSMRSLF